MPNSVPFDLLGELYGDGDMAAILTAEQTVRCWLRVEAALAGAQAELGLVPPETAAAIDEVCVRPETVDLPKLWQTARTVGYPILGLVRHIDQALPPEHRGHTHLGATTQDIMDSAVALQLRDALTLLESRLVTVGDHLAELTADHRDLVMPGRTHGQQSTPITFGAKMAVFLSEVTRHLVRLRRARAEVSTVSLFGASGTSAALGSRAADIRSAVASRLGLRSTGVPWHVARDRLIDAAHTCENLVTTLGRLAREVANLSRTEIGEVSEVQGHHRGASSTMPQKANPISSESIRGFAITASALAQGVVRAADVEHERSMGEWQAEWSLLPLLLVHTSSAATLAGDLTESLAVNPDRMRANLSADNGLIMSEAAMIALSPQLGREHAHDVVYELAVSARRESISLAEALDRWQQSHPEIAVTVDLDPASYLGDCQVVCDDALTHWRAMAEERTDASRES